MLDSIPKVTRALLIANVAMFVIGLMVGDAFILNLALWPIGNMTPAGGSLGFQPWQIITYSFLHGNITHLLFNMLALYMFGGELERLFGQQRYLNLYFLSVITAAIAQLVFSAAAGVEEQDAAAAAAAAIGG